ncbi:HAD family hydrolase [Clostridium sp.]|uniref:HAD family hydrolase n=1 Tax=Clostridium sp. TaxID=1506 RepID=UPI003A5C6F17
MDLYISDLDGTLLNSKRVVSSNSIKIINNLIDSGVNFTIATARSYEASKDILRPLKLKIPVILNNGAFVSYISSGESIVQNYLDESTVKFILDTYNLKGINPFISAVDKYGNKKIFFKGAFNRGQEIYLDSREKSRDKRLTKVKDFSMVKDYNIINIFAIEREGILDFEYKTFRDTLKVSCHYTEEIYSKGFFWLEITNVNANKSSAALYLKKYINADRLICFGDNLNDLPLFKVADEKYAVDNAYMELKNIATKVIGSNEEDGVAKFLREKVKF